MNQKLDRKENKYQSRLLILKNGYSLRRHLIYYLRKLITDDIQNAVNHEREVFGMCFLIKK